MLLIHFTMLAPIHKMQGNHEEALISNQPPNGLTREMKKNISSTNKRTFKQREPNDSS